MQLDISEVVRVTGHFTLDTIGTTQHDFTNRFLHATYGVRVECTVYLFAIIVFTTTLTGQLPLHAA